MKKDVSMTMKRNLFLLFITGVFCTSIIAQELEFTMKDISLSGTASFSAPLKKGYSSAGGYGAAMAVKIAIFGELSLSLNIGYQRFIIEQPKAVTNWNWVYWTKYYRSYINTDWLGDSIYFNGTKVKTSSLTDDQVTSGTPMIRKDNVYEASIRARQYLSMVNGGISLTYDYPLTEMLTPFITAGLNMYVIDRNLFLEEEWAKRRKADAGPDSGQVYTFRYNYENYAPGLTGEVYGGMSGIGCDLNFSELLGLKVEADYYFVYTELNKTAYAYLPFKGFWNTSLGIRVRY